LAAILFALAAAAVVFAPRWIVSHDVGKLTAAARADAIGSARTAVLALLAGVFAVVGAVYTSLSYRLNRRGQATDRYTRAIDQLGNEKSDVQLGGIYGLERLADESPEDAPQIIEVLSAFIREHSPAVPVVDDERGEERELQRPGAPVIAAFRVLARRGPDETPGTRFLDLSATRLEFVEVNDAWLPYTRLPRAQLMHASLHAANLKACDMSEADLTFAKVTEADMTYVDLRGARLYGAELRVNDFRAAALEKANLETADLAYSDLGNARLTGANLGAATLRQVRAENANLVDAQLSDAILEDAFLVNADLSGAKLNDANLRSASLIDARLRGADLRGADLTHADLTRADLTGTDLTGAAFTGVRGLQTAVMPDGWQSQVADQP